MTLEMEEGEAMHLMGKTEATIVGQHLLNEDYADIGCVKFATEPSFHVYLLAVRAQGT